MMILKTLYENVNSLEALGNLICAKKMIKGVGVGRWMFSFNSPLDSQMVCVSGWFIISNCFELYLMYMVFQELVILPSSWSWSSLG